MLAKQTLIKTALASFMLIALTGCPFDGDSDNNQVTVPTPPAPTPTPPPPAEYSYDVVISNLTNAQPLSPLGVALHGDARLFAIGEAASTGLEILAEGGDNKEFLAQSGILASASSSGVIMPGTNTTVSITTTDRTATHISLATMLVNTNDAFTGLTGLDISSFEINGSKSWVLGTYDAGTEANTEAAGTIPGPADGGTGYSDVRDDTGVVSMHSGVVSKDDGLTSSVLTQAHRFDNPTMRLTITRTK